MTERLFPPVFNDIPELWTAPAGTLAESYPRWMSFATFIPTSGQLRFTPIYLLAGMKVSNIIIPINAAGATLTHSWWGLYTSAATPVQLSVSADNTTAAWTIFTERTFAQTAPYVVLTSGLYLIGGTQVGTTPGQLYSFTGQAQLNTYAPKLGITAQSGLTTPTATVTGPTTDAAIHYARVT